MILLSIITNTERMTAASCTDCALLLFLLLLMLLLLLLVTVLVNGLEGLELMLQLDDWLEVYSV